VELLVEQITRERLEAEFGNDPLYDAIQRMNLLDELFDQETLSVLVERHEYTTTDFEKWFCVSEADERYLSTPGIMRAFVKELGSYLQTRNLGRTIIIDYQGVIKLKMALLLRKNGMKPALIYETAGAKAYSPSVITRPNTMQPQSPAAPKTQKDLLYDQLMESLITQLTAAGAVSQGADGKIHVDLRMLIEKQIELMAPSLLPAETEETQQKLEQLDHEITHLRTQGERDREVVDEIQRKYEEGIIGVTESVSELKMKLDSETTEIKKTQELKNECRAKAVAIYQKLKGTKNINEMEELASQLGTLEDDYPDLLYIIRDFSNRADELISKVKFEEKQKREAEVKEECLRLYNVMIDPKSTKAQVEGAKTQLMKLQEENRDIAFEIRAFIAAAQNASENNRDKGGFFSWFKRPKH
jgi:hypothetical protein